MIENEQKKTLTDGQILGYNVLAFIAYTLVCFAVDKGGGFIAFFISIAQFFICVIIAIAAKRAIWLLGGFLAVLIGFGTCVGNFVIH